MGELVAEILLRLLKVLAAVLLGGLVYLVASSVDPAAAGATLGVASFVAGAGVVLLLESSPL
jgi:hypothetical protein